MNRSDNLAMVESVKKGNSILESSFRSAARPKCELKTNSRGCIALVAPVTGPQFRGGTCSTSFLMNNL